MSVDVQVIIPQTASYLSATPRNKRMTVYPQAIAFPTKPDQVKDIVKEISNDKKKNRRRVVVLSGGHSSIANSLGGTHGAVVIDLSNMKVVDYDEKTFRITFQPGNRLADVIIALAQHKRAIAHGTCPSVAIGGHSAFGGWGLASRMWGLNCDAIQSMQVVTDNGTQKTISANNDSDLFWAMRGAAPSFAIATSLTYDTQPAPENTVNFKYEALMSPKDIANSIVKFQKNVDNVTLVPKELGIQLRVDKGKGDGKLLFRISGTYFGQEKKFTDDIEPDLLKLIKRDKASETLVDSRNEGIPFPPADPATFFSIGYAVKIIGNHYSNAIRIGGDITFTGDSAAFAKAVGPFIDEAEDNLAAADEVDDTLVAATEEADNLAYIRRVVNPGVLQAFQTETAAAAKIGRPDPLVSFYIKTLMAPALNKAALLSCLKYANQNQFIPLDWFIAFKLMGGKDSVIPKKPSTAFGWRDALWFVELNADARVPPPYPGYGYEFLDGLVNGITSNMPNARFGAYPGFLDDRLENYNEMYYADNYTKLKKIKESKAKNNIFVFPQCI